MKLVIVKCKKYVQFMYGSNSIFNEGEYYYARKEKDVYKIYNYEKTTWWNIFRLGDNAKFHVFDEHFEIVKSDIFVNRNKLNKLIQMDKPNTLSNSRFEKMSFAAEKLKGMTTELQNKLKNTNVIKIPLIISDDPDFKNAIIMKYNTIGTMAMLESNNLFIEKDSRHVFSDPEDIDNIIGCIKSIDFNKNVVTIRLLRDINISNVKGIKLITIAVIDSTDSKAKNIMITKATFVNK
jgi:hypothetical protein